MSMKSIGNFLAGPGGLFVLLFFFMPWITMNCSGVEFIEASGADLASGIDEDNLSLDESELGFDESMFEGAEGFEEGEITFESEFTGSEDGENPSFFDADAILYIFPIIGIIAILVAGFSFFEPRMANLYTSVGGYILPSLLGLAVLVYKYLQISGDMDDLNAQAAADSTGLGVTLEIIQLNYEAGWWMTGFGLVAIFIGGVVVFLFADEGKKTAAPIPQPTGGASADTAFGSAFGQSSASDFGAAFRQDTSDPFAGIPTTDAKPKSDKEKFAEAKTLIESKRYDEARAILHTIDHPKAQEWLDKLKGR
jgi:hypothetical protein